MPKNPSMCRHLLVAGLMAACLAANVPRAGAQSTDELIAPVALLPTPKSFVSNLDLECFATPGPALNRVLSLTHLNPVLQGLPQHRVILRELTQTCVPVRKNNAQLPFIAQQFVRHVDLACYRVDAAPLQNPAILTLRHLNPVLSHLPPHVVRLLQPQQVCLPVGKNNQPIPAAVRSVVRYLDLECYRAQPLTYHPNFGVTVRQLNPQLTNIFAHGLPLTGTPRQMCVPVRKNQQIIPAPALKLVRWVDLEMFAVSPIVSILPRQILLNHQNPLFVNYPPVPVVLQRARALMVPVSKNGATPP